MSEPQAYVLLVLLSLLLVGVSIIAVSLQRMLWRTDTRRQRVVLPLSSGKNVKPDPSECSVQITSKPQNTAFRPERIIIGGHPEHWIVNDVKVGNLSQFAQSGDVPGEMFSSSAIDCFLRMAPVALHQDFVIVATYIGPEPDGEPFTCGVLGTALSDRDVRRASTLDRSGSLHHAHARATI